MSKLKPNNFLKTMSSLRQEEHLVIHDDVLKTTKSEDDDVLLFLEQDYENESLNYPFTPPKFNPKAALWASKIVYYSALLLLHRKDTKKDLTILFPNFEGTINVSAILSADLCLRFVPQINFELKRIDAEDPLIPILETILKTWHYSTIHNDCIPPAIDYTTFFKNDCLTQLYLNRIIERKQLQWAEIPYINTLLHNRLGYYKNHFWNTLKPNEIKTNEH
ncbi:hypothetical protein [Pontimicrobium sp. MEBiC01747]